MDITTKNLPTALIRVLERQLTPYIHSSPGMGKSEIVRKVATHFNLTLIDCRLSQMDPVDLLGMPAIKGNRCEYKLPLMFPLVGDPIPEGKNGWLIFFDELNTANPAMQAGAYKLILENMVGDEPLHPNVVKVAAGNLDSDRAVTNRLSTALQSRMVHFNLVLDAERQDWLNWAVDSNIDPRILGFIQFRKNLLHNFNPAHKDNTFPCPRTWVFLSTLIQGKKVLDELDTIIAAGTVGEGPALEFMGFCRHYESLPTIQQILSSPETVPFPESPEVYFALTSLVAYEATPSNLSQLVKLVNRLPLDFQIVAWRTALRKQRDLINEPSMKAWVTQNAKELL